MEINYPSFEWADRLLRSVAGEHSVIPSPKVFAKGKALIPVRLDVKGPVRARPVPAGGLRTSDAILCAGLAYIFYRMVAG